MRALIGFAICGLLASACGGAKKPAVDPTAATTPADEASETKWDATSETAESARRSKSLSASSPSSRSGGARDSAGAPSGSSSGTEPMAASPVQKQRRSDEYDKEGTEVVLKRAARQVKANCGAATDENGKANGPWGQGKMTLVLGNHGHMRDVSIGAPFEGQPTGRCAVQAFKLLTYPPWAGSDMTIDYTVDIVAPGTAEKKK